ncbi:MAG: hypothetical protein P1U36_08645 [Legionellaceae bacterium]|nr:hypothetical protein [Legionellaceae bacterium]
MSKKKKIDIRVKRYEAKQKKLRVEFNRLAADENTTVMQLEDLNERNTRNNYLLEHARARRPLPPNILPTIDEEKEEEEQEQEQEALVIDRTPQVKDLPPPPNRPPPAPTVAQQNERKRKNKAKIEKKDEPTCSRMTSQAAKYMISGFKNALRKPQQPKGLDTDEPRSDPSMKKD